MTTIDITELPNLLDEAGIPNDIVAKMLLNPHMLQRVLEALGTIDFDSMETTRAYAFLLLADRSKSVKLFRDALISCYRGTVDKLRPIKTVGTLLVGCMAITNEVEGGEVILPFQPIASTVIGDDLDFNPAGTTPLYDDTVVALVALRILIVLAKRAGIILTAMAYLISDGSDVGSVMFTLEDAAAMVALMTTGRRKHRVSAVAVGLPLESLFTQMGIASDAIREIGTAADDLERLFDEMSRSVTATSQGGNAGGF